MNTLQKLPEYGQSYWMDNLSRAMIENGELRGRMEQQGLRGITSNPKIFMKAIANSEDYDQQIKQLAEQGRTIAEIYQELVVKDVRDACDILRPVYDKTEGLDGYVSLEVSPYLAHDTAGTEEEVRRLWQAVDRPNLFIKIPGTPEGIPAIENMLYEGININITLLFSVDTYREVAEAYLRALERRVSDGKPVEKLASVASFFLSRIDVLADQLLGHRIKPGVTEGDTLRPEELLGKAAIANAKIAYQHLKEILKNDRWKKLAERGARVQRLLWASTSTKDPLYDSVRYVEPLVGKHTVNTMPPETSSAFAGFGVIKENGVEDGVDEARQILKNLEAVGVDFSALTWQLLHEGVQKFIDPFDELMTVLARERQKLYRKSLGTQQIAYGDLKSTAQSAFDSLDSRQFSRRLFEKDPYLWKSDPDAAKEITNRLGWLESIDEFLVKAGVLKQFAEEIKNERFRHVVLLGMGGSSLCPEVCRDIFGSAEGWPELLVLDDIDPSAVQAVQSQIELRKTLFIVSSKSGTTTETMSLYQYFFNQFEQHQNTNIGEHFVAITDSGTPLAQEAAEKGFRRTFENPADIGGRYSALSYFGLVPMALMGMDIEALLRRARNIQVDTGPFVPTEGNDGLKLGAFLGLNYRHGRDKITFVLPDSIAPFGQWVEQLLAESLGKENAGLVPVIGEALAEPDKYSPDRVFVYLFTPESKHESVEKKLSALEDAGHPVIYIDVADKLNLGAEFYRWELATATAAAVIGVNPFDEPNVAESKQNTRDLLEEFSDKGQLRESDPFIQQDELAIFCKTPPKNLGDQQKKEVPEFLNAWFGQATSGDYIALLPFFRQTVERQKLLQSLRTHLRDRFALATTLGYGPRYLHSTGQLHKGGPNSGIFLLLTADPGEDREIPGHSYSFATLQHAQALGDYRSLVDKNRRVIRLHLGQDISDGLNKLSKWLK